MAEIANNSIDIQVVETGGENAQYFWHNTVDSGNGEGAGAHVTQIPKADFVADPENGGGNTLITSNGMAVRNGTEVMANFGNSAITLYTADGVPAFVVNSGSGSSQQTITKVIDLYFDIIKGVNYAKTYTAIDSVPNGENFDLEVYCRSGETPAERGTATFTKGTSSVQSYSLDVNGEVATVTATYNGAKQITWKFTNVVPDEGLAGFYLTVDTLSYTATVNDATTEVSGNMIWKNPDQVFVVETYTVTYGNLSSGGVVNLQQTVYKTGYYPIGCVSFNANRSGLYVDRAEVTNRAVGSCDIWFHARAGISVSGNTAYMDVLWVKAE